MAGFKILINEENKKHDFLGKLPKFIFFYKNTISYFIFLLTIAPRFIFNLVDVDDKTFREKPKEIIRPGKTQKNFTAGKTPKKLYGRENPRKLYSLEYPSLPPPRSVFVPCQSGCRSE